MNEDIAIIGWNAFKSGDTATALQLLQHAAPRARSAETYVALAVVLDASGDKTRAVTALQRAVKLAPQHLGAWCALAELHVEQSQWQEAIGALKRCVALDPECKTSEGTRARVLVLRAKKALQKRS